MDATPQQLKSDTENIYKQIAIALEGGELRDVGLANLAANLMKRVPRTPIVVDAPAHTLPAAQLHASNVESSV
eukprot:6696123-Prymnesium_polylepis.2